MRKILFLILVISCFNLDAQYKRRLNPIFTNAPGYPMGGWFFEPGITYGYHQGKLENVIVKETTDSLVVGDLTPKSYPFIYLGAGRFNLFPNGLIVNMIDYGIAFKGVAYNQDFKGRLFYKNDNTLAPEDYEDEGRWSDYNVTVNFNINRYIQLTEKFFLMPGIGVHGDFRVAGTQSFSLDTAIAGYRFQDDLKFSAHARLHFGIKIHRELFIVPGFEVQLYDLVNTDVPKITRTYFNSEYCPVMFTVKVMYHKPPPRKPCKVGVSDIDLDNNRRRKRKIHLY